MCPELLQLQSVLVALHEGVSWNAPVLANPLTMPSPSVRA